MTDGADVEVRLGALEFLLCHLLCYSCLTLPALGCQRILLTSSLTASGERAGRMIPLAGAHNRTRTDDLALTKGVLCQLSYVGATSVLCYRSSSLCPY